MRNQAAIRLAKWTWSLNYIWDVKVIRVCNSRSVVLIPGLNLSVIWAEHSTVVELNSPLLPREGHLSWHFPTVRIEGMSLGKWKSTPLWLEIVVSNSIPQVSAAHRDTHCFTAMDSGIQALIFFPYLLICWFCIYLFIIKALFRHLHAAPCPRCATAWRARNLYCKMIINQIQMTCGNSKTLLFTE